VEEAEAAAGAAEETGGPAGAWCPPQHPVLPLQDLLLGPETAAEALLRRQAKEQLQAMLATMGRQAA
jgi:hypothetical protein